MPYGTRDIRNKGMTNEGGGKRLSQPCRPKAKTGELVLLHGTDYEELFQKTCSIHHIYPKSQWYSSFKKYIWLPIFLVLDLQIKFRITNLINRKKIQKLGY
jgi:hypothetical protein